MHQGVGFVSCGHSCREESFVDVIQLNGFRGSADALRQLRPQIHNDCIVVTGNIMRNVDLYSIANMYRCEECAFFVVLSMDEKHVADKNKVRSGRLVNRRQIPYTASQMTCASCPTAIFYRATRTSSSLAR